MYIIVKIFVVKTEVLISLYQNDGIWKHEYSRVTSGYKWCNLPWCTSGDVNNDECFPVKLITFICIAATRNIFHGNQTCCLSVVCLTGKPPPDLTCLPSLVDHEASQRISKVENKWRSWRERNPLVSTSYGIWWALPSFVTKDRKISGIKNIQERRI